MAGVLSVSDEDLREAAPIQRAFGEVVSEAAELMDSKEIMDFFATPHEDLRIAGVAVSPRDWLLRGEAAGPVRRLLH